MVRVCRKGRAACFSLCLGLCQKARPRVRVRAEAGSGSRGCSCPACGWPCGAEGQAAPQHPRLPRGQRSPSGNRVQPGLERGKRKPGKRPKLSSLLLLCFCSHEEQWQSLSEQLGTQGFLLGSLWHESAAPRRWQLGMSQNPQWDRGRNLLPEKQEEKQLSFSESWSHLPRLAEA